MSEVLNVAAPSETTSLIIARTFYRRKNVNCFMTWTDTTALCITLSLDIDAYLSELVMGAQRVCILSHEPQSGSRAH
jgi:hypothetical protein